MESILIPERRIEIYLAAAAIIDQNQEHFCCRAIGKVFHLSAHPSAEMEDIERLFPEFWLFKSESVIVGNIKFNPLFKSESVIVGNFNPLSDRVDVIDFNYGWFGKPSPETKQERIVCLLLCAEMVKNNED